MAGPIISLILDFVAVRFQGERPPTLTNYSIFSSVYKKKNNHKTLQKTLQLIWLKLCI